MPETFQILNRFSGAVQFECELSAEIAGSRFGLRLGFAIKKAVETRADLRDAVLTGAVLRDADLRDAVLTGAVLRDADLTRADLRDAVLTGAVLRDADLRDAVLTGAVLRDADLRDAVLTGAVLRDADLTRAVLTGAGIPVIPHIDAAILAAIKAGGTLKMSNWHTCNTTHCRAGWAITLAGDAGQKLENIHGPAAAGALIYAASRPGKRIPNFYASDADAMADIEACAQEEV